MQQKQFSFSNKSTTCYFNAGFGMIDEIADPATTIFITDENIIAGHRNRFDNRRVIVITPGEANKTQATVDSIVTQLIQLEADRKFTIVGVGGGVVTDLSGYAASIYMRGLRFGFVPVSLLAMVDASIGGKNGVDVGPYKNLVGTIRQPDFLLYDSSFLSTLPQSEWINGFAEIIKHACIKDTALFDELEKNSVDTYRSKQALLNALIQRNAEIKCGVVMNDEFEKGERKLLNFGHTWGHAIETKLNIPHGHAVAVGMVMACRLSEKINGFKETDRVMALLKKYGLPVAAEADTKEVFKVLKMDKKKDSGAMNYILLNNIGDAAVHRISIDELEKMIEQCK
jgi:3-dehydroquinate synthase